MTKNELEWEAIQLIPSGIYTPEDFEILLQMCIKHLKKKKNNDKTRTNINTTTS